MFGYSKMSKEKQYNVSTLVLQMKSLLTDTKTEAINHQSKKGPVSINVPTAHTLQTETKKGRKSKRKLKWQPYLQIL